MSRHLAAAAALAAIALPFAPMAGSTQPDTDSQAERIDRGERLYRQTCSACHSLDSNRVGPRHRGLFGRRAGSVEDYPYSRALARSGLVWTSETLDAWLEDPTGLVPGTAMGIRVRDPAARAAIIAYLGSQTENPAD